MANDESNLLTYLTSLGLEVVDRRDKGGALWVIGDEQKLKSIMQDLQSKGYEFKYLEQGGRASKHRPAWWIKSQL